MDTSTVLTICLFSWFFLGAVTVLIFNGLAAQKCKRLNKRLAEIDEPERNWMNPCNLLQHRNEIRFFAPQEYKAIAKVFIGWAVACVILLVAIQMIFFLAPLFVD